MCNDMACELFGFTDEDLVSKKLSKLLKVKKREQGALEELQLDSETGDIIKISGKIVSQLNKCSLKHPICLIMLRHLFS